MQRLWCLVRLAGLLAVMLGAAAPALADGGATIATAPVVPPGQQQFGNTLSGGAPAPGTHCNDNETQWWKLNLTAGDRVIVDWAVQQGTVSYLFVYPAATTDFNINSVNAVTSQSPGSNNDNEEIFTADRTGVWPIAFCGALFHDGGPYNFTTKITHAIVLEATARDEGRHVRITVAAHTPDGTALAKGVAVSAFLSIAGHWRRVARASLRGTTVRLGFVPPASLRGKTVRLEVAVAGPSYQATLKRISLRIGR